MFKNLFVILFILVAFVSNGQEKYFLHLDVKDSTDVKLNVKSQYGSKIELEKALDELILRTQSKGYLEANVDLKYWKGTHLTASVHAGEKYKWIDLRPSKESKWIEYESWFKWKGLRDKPIKLEQWKELQETTIEYLERNGFPFASIYLDSINVEPNVSARIVVDKGVFFHYDTITLDEPIKLNKTYLYKYLDLKPGDAYDEQTYELLQDRLSQLPFISNQADFERIFDKEKAATKLYLKDRPVSTFSAILAVQQNNDIAGRLVVSGDVDIHLWNPWGNGMEVLLNWKRLSPSVQSIEASGDYPYIFGSSMGGSYGINMYRDDSFFINVKQSIGVKYLFGGNHYLKGFFEIDQNNVIIYDTTSIKQSKSLPEMLDVATSYYGLEWEKRRLNRLFNPSRGYKINGKIAVGLKQIKESLLVKNLVDDEGREMSYLYDAISPKSTLLKAEATLTYFQSLNNVWVLVPSSKMAIISSADGSAPILENELYRIGGFKTLRGVDEQSLFADRYMINSLSIRAAMGSNLYWETFSDWAFVSAKENSGLDQYLALGTGFNLQTKNGVFSISYAIGKTASNPFDLRAAKIHMGYISYF